MANEVIRKQYGIDNIVRRTPEDRGEFFIGFVPWPDDMDGWRRSTREQFREAGDRSLVRTIWDSPQDRDSRVLIDVVECGSTADAVEALADWLEANQLEQVPEGPEGLGLASFQHPEFAPPAVVFAKGNLRITVTSFGRKAVDVAQIAWRLNVRLDERPTGAQQPLPLEVGTARGKVGQEILLRYTPPVRKDEDGYLKLFVTRGTILRREQQLILRATSAGPLSVEAYLVEPGRQVHAGKLTITIE